MSQARASFIDARDIAAVVSASLQSDRFNNRDFDLTGGESLTHDQAAKLISEATGKHITFEDTSPEVMLDQLKRAGLPTDYAQFLLVILGPLKAGHAKRVTDAVESITGHQPTSFAQYAKDYRSAWVLSTGRCQRLPSWWADNLDLGRVELRAEHEPSVIVREP